MLSDETDHAFLVEAVKCQQRSSEIAREGWRHYCGALADGVRDPQKHSSEFLRNFLKVLETGQKIPQKQEDYDVRLVRSGCPSLGARQVELWMPESEVSVMKEVVNANCYGLAPGKSSLLSTGDVVLDVGAHVGTASALALRTPEVKVICVEPHPKTFEILHRNLEVAVEAQTAILLNLAVAEGDETRDLYAHRGTNNPSRLFFASLFDTRSHADDPISVQCVALQDLIFRYDPSVVKIDAEGAERFLLAVEDFGSVRCLVVEWDWTHNKERKCWEEVKAHLEHHDFKLRLRQALPTFDASGCVELTDPRGRKRGSTGMIFVATRKVAETTKAESSFARSLSATETSRLVGRESELETYLVGASVQPSLELQLHALSMEQLEARLRYFGEAVREVSFEEFFHIGFKERRRAELVHSLLSVYQQSGAPRRVYQQSMEGVPLPMDGVQQLLEVLRKVKFEENLRPSVHASGYLVLKAAQAVKFAESWGEERVLGQLWQVAEELLRGASTKAAAFHFTAMAVTKNFRGSPHVDQNDFSVQYALSVGDFDQGGELCVEETPEFVQVLNTHNRLVCIDGRFPHWVSGYGGERYSIIFYRTAGDWDPPCQAVHPV